MTDSVETEPSHSSYPPLEKEAPSPAPPPVLPLSPGPLAPSAPPDLIPAGFVRRAVAFVMDFFLINMLYLLLVLFGMLGISMASAGFPSIEQIATPFLFVGILLFVGYFTFFHATEGQTPAKKVLRIKVVKTDGALLSYGSAFVRCALGYSLSSSFLGIGFFMALFGEKKRALHDFLTASYVVLSAD